MMLTPSTEILEPWSHNLTPPDRILRCVRPYTAQHWVFDVYLMDGEARHGCCKTPCALFS